MTDKEKKSVEEELENKASEVGIAQRAIESQVGVNPEAREDNELTEEELQFLEKPILSKGKALALGLALVVLVASCVTLLIYYMPLTSKIQGNWHSEKPENYVLEIKKDGRAKFINTSTETAYKAWIETTLKGVGANQYRGEHTKSYIELNKKELDSKIIEDAKAQVETYVVEKETQDVLLLSNTTTANKSAYGMTDINNLFRLEQDYQFFKKKKSSLFLRNDTFALTGIEFNNKKRAN